MTVCCESLFSVPRLHCTRSLPGPVTEPGVGVTLQLPDEGAAEMKVRFAASVSVTVTFSAALRPFASFRAVTT